MKKSPTIFPPTISFERAESVGENWTFAGVEESEDE